MSVLDNLNRIKSCKEDIKQAIINKGVDMTGVSLEGYATKISEIQAGGGSGDYLDIRANLSTYYSTVEMVGCGDFAYCPSIQSVNLPMCRSVGANAFISCPSLQSVNLPMCSYISNSAFQFCSSLTSVNLPMCSYVAGSAFQFCESLQSINLPMCGSVGANAFAQCSSLTSVNLPMCGSVDMNTFSRCSSLQSINIPMCSYVGNYAFQSCSSLQSINIPMCGYVAGSAFQYCKSLSVLDLRSTYSCNLLNSKAFSSTPFASGIGSIYVHNAVLSQFQNATNWTYFSNCFVGVGDPTRPLLSIDSGRVYGDTPALYISWTSYLGTKSSSVSSIDLPNVNILSTSAGFSHFYSLVELSMENLISAPNEMCYYCSSLQSVNLPICEYIGMSAFQYCKSLQSINLPNCSYVKGGAFRYCSSLQSVNLPICEYIDWQTFAYCSSLQSVNLPICEYIGEYAFIDCSSLQSVNLPMCKYIGDRAIYDHEGLTLYIGTSLSSVCELDGVFGITIPGSSKSIFVPMSLVDAYKSAPYWSYYSKYIFGI